MNTKRNIDMLKFVMNMNTTIQQPMHHKVNSVDHNF